MFDDLSELSRMKEHQMKEDRTYKEAQLAIEIKRLKLEEEESAAKVEKIKAETENEQVQIKQLQQAVDWEKIMLNVELL